MSKFSATFKKHPVLFSLIIVGVVLWFIYKVIYNSTDYDVTGGIRLLGYVSFFIFFIGLLGVLFSYKRTIPANIVLTLFLVFCIELTCFFLLGMPTYHKKNFDFPELPEDHIANNIGNVPWADSVHTSILVNGNDTVYNVKQTIDTFCKRSTPGHDSAKHKYALFFGCSVAFGTGLNDYQTMAYNFQQDSKEYNTYNYGIPGHGTNHMLARLQFKNLTPQVKEKDGIGLYIFLWDHINRSIGTMDRYCDWLSNAPYYEMEDGQLVRNKMFYDGRYFQSKFYEWVYQTNIIKYFKIDFPVKIKERHYDLVTEMIKEAKNEYQKQFGNDRFYCVLFPYWVGTTPKDLPIFIEYLKKKNIAYIDLTDYRFTAESTLGGDPHPNANTSAELSKILYDRVLKLSK
ncbi:MAG TPA: hypothetical protein PK289_09085 [Bacteroidia bacterium]|nr:hypothetical protein [Bacteroidia bacterium]HRG52743.1 hypothetical protein [Bacteroidia bacterium]